MSEIILPNNWRPRQYQKPLWRYLEEGGRRAYQIAHRRWGKDDVCLHWSACAAMQRVGGYWHMLPEAAQARKAIWDAINPHTGLRRIDEAFPKEIRRRTVDNEMKIELVTGSIWQVLGSDNYNSYVGAPPVGVTFSEWPLADPQAWAYTMPILEENDGWAFFIGTPRGRNHGKRFLDAAKANPNWYASVMAASQTDVFSATQLERIKAELIALYGEDEGGAKFEQEYECSFDAALPGAYYGKEISAAERENRICRVPHDPRYPVFPIFDLGHGDSTSIIYVQVVGRELRVVDYHESSGQDMAFYAKLLRETGYNIPHVILPHDGAAGNIRGASCDAQLKAAGFKVKVLARGDIDAGIKLARTLLKHILIDVRQCERLVDCLRSYHREEFQQQQQEQQRQQQQAQYQQWYDSRSEQLANSMQTEIGKNAEFQQLVQENADIIQATPAHIDHLFLQLDPAIATKAGLTLLKEGKLESLFSMPAALAAAEIGRALERSAAVLAPKATSNAPRPMTPNRGTGPAGKSDDSMSGAELMRKYGI